MNNYLGRCHLLWVLSRILESLFLHLKKEKANGLPCISVIVVERQDVKDIKKVSNNVTVQLNKLIYNAYTYEQLFSSDIVLSDDDSLRWLTIQNNFFKVFRLRQNYCISSHNRLLNCFPIDNGGTNKIVYYSVQLISYFHLLNHLLETFSILYNTEKHAL